jgi:hypothetical protein
MRRLILTMLCVLALWGVGFVQAFAQDGLVEVSTDRDSYPNGKRVTVSIHNGLDEPIWVNTTCGVPFILHEVNGCEVQVHGADAGKECNSPPLKIPPKSGHQETMNLKIYTHVFFNLPPGQYRMAIQYFREDPSLIPGLPTPYHVTSGTFTLR